jgi:hypothetical protein
MFGIVTLLNCNAVDILFTFVNHATGEPFELGEFDMTFFDLDEGKFSSEEMIVEGYESYKIADTSQAQVKEFPGHRLQASYAPGHGNSKNPEDPMVLDDMQKSHAILFTFKNRASASMSWVSTCTKPVRGTRNLVFAFRSGLKEPPAPCAPAPKVPGIPYGYGFRQVCPAGHSVDGSANPASKAMVTRCSCGQGCQQDKCSMTSVPECQPVTCGAPPVKANMITRSAGLDIFFGETVTYHCDRGFSFDGTRKGARKQSVLCLSSGVFEATQPCKPVGCGQPPVFENASVEGNVYMLPEAYSLCPQRHKLADQGACKAALSSLGIRGEMEVSEEPGPGGCSVSGGKGFWRDASPGDVASGVSPICMREVMYLDTLAIKCHFGYTFDPKNPKTTTMSLACGADGRLEEPEAGKEHCVPISCGKPPEVFDAKYDDRDYVFGESVTYKCNNGTTADGTATGVTSFTASCDGDGVFTDPISTFCSRPVAPPMPGKIIDAITFMGVKDAKVTIGKLTATTNAMGKFVISGIQFGENEVKVERDGYEPYEATMDIPTGQTFFREMLLFPPLGDGDMRVTLTWGRGTKDLDLHAYLSPAAMTTHLSFSRPIINVPGLAGELGFDMTSDGKQDGAMEYMTLHNVAGHCKDLSDECRIAFRAHSPMDDKPGKSHGPYDYFKTATVTVTDSTGKKTEFPGGGYTAGNPWWSVFVIDGLTGEIHKCNNEYGGCLGIPGGPNPVKFFAENLTKNVKTPLNSTLHLQGVEAKMRPIAKKSLRSTSPTGQASRARQTSAVRVVVSKDMPGFNVTSVIGHRVSALAGL